MYTQHFGLAQYPFSLTPNTRFFMKLPGHQIAFNQLIKALNDDGVFSKITGEVGTGKTMLCRKALNALEAHSARYVTAFIPHPILSEDAIIRAIAEELHLPFEEESSYREMLKLVSNAIVDLNNLGKCVVLFIDEAQAMPEESLKAVELLTRVESKNGRKLQVVLFGQPELEKLLDEASVARVKENLKFSYHLPALDRDGTEAYVQHRLAKAGYSGPHMFSTAAVDLLYEASNGVPRLINILSHKAMMVAFGKGELQIKEDFMKAAIADTESSNQKPGWRERWFGKS